MDTKKKFKIVVLEDNKFYNTILKWQLQSYADTLAKEMDCDFDVKSYTTVIECLRSMHKEDKGIILIDYYLDNGIKAIDILKRIKEKYLNYQAIVISKMGNFDLISDSLVKGALQFVHKDKNTLPNLCKIIKSVALERC